MASWPAPDECRGCGDGDEGFGDGGELLVVTGEPAVLDDPGEGPLNDPAAAQHFEALGGRIAFDDLDDDVGLILGPAHEPTGVAAIGKGALHEWISRSGGFQHELAAVAILDAGGVNPDGEEAAVGVGQDVALAAFDLLARVVALRAPF
jgi:hypothetical protein